MMNKKYMRLWNQPRKDGKRAKAEKSADSAHEVRWKLNLILRVNRVPLVYYIIGRGFVSHGLPMYTRQSYMMIISLCW